MSEIKSNTILSTSGSNYAEWVNATRELLAEPIEKSLPLIAVSEDRDHDAFIFDALDNNLISDVERIRSKAESKRTDDERHTMELFTADNRAKRIIKATIEPELRTQLENQVNARRMWVFLRDRFSRLSAQTVHTIQAKMKQTCAGISDWRRYYAEVARYRERYQAECRGVLDDLMHLDLLRSAINSDPDLRTFVRDAERELERSNQAKTWEAVTKIVDEMTTNQLIRPTQETEVKAVEPAMKLAKMNFKRAHDNSCWNCGEEGHYARDCTSKDDEEEYDTTSRKPRTEHRSRTISRGRGNRRGNDRSESRGRNRGRDRGRGRGRAQSGRQHDRNYRQRDNKKAPHDAKKKDTAKNKDDKQDDDDEKEQPMSLRTMNMRVNVTKAQSDSLDDGWLGDSCSTHHFTDRKSDFYPGTYVEFRHAQRCELGKGMFCDVLGKGVVKFQVEDDLVTLPVYYGPNLPRVISTGKLMKQGWTIGASTRTHLTWTSEDPTTKKKINIKFNLKPSNLIAANLKIVKKEEECEYHVFVHDATAEDVQKRLNARKLNLDESKEPVRKFDPLHNEIQVVDMSDAPPGAVHVPLGNVIVEPAKAELNNTLDFSSVISRQEAVARYLHHVFGHYSNRYIRRTLRRYAPHLLRYFPHDAVCWCWSCKQTKARKLPFNVQDKTGDQSIKFMQLYADDWSRNVWIDLTTKKDDSDANLYTDLGAEVNTTRMNEFVKAKGIRWHQAPKQVHERNGTAESLIGKIQDIGRALLKESGLPQRCWPHAFRQALTIYGMMVDKRGQSPNERFTRKYPRLDQLLPFGADCIVTVLKTDQANGKLGDRGLPGKYVGYDSERHTHRVLLIQKGIMAHKAVEVVHFQVDKSKWLRRVVLQSGEEMPDEGSDFPPTESTRGSLGLSSRGVSNPSDTSEALASRTIRPEAPAPGRGSGHDNRDPRRGESVVHPIPPGIVDRVTASGQSAERIREELDMKTVERSDDAKNAIDDANAIEPGGGNNSDFGDNQQNAQDANNEQKFNAQSEDKHDNTYFDGSGGDVGTNEHDEIRRIVSDAFAEEQPTNEHNLRIRPRPQYVPQRWRLHSTKFNRNGDEPSLQQALKSDEAEFWNKSCLSEVQKLVDNGTLAIRDQEEVPQEVRDAAIDFTFALRKKRDEDGNLKEYKSRLCARGDQVNPVDQEDSFAPTPRFSSIRLILVLSGTIPLHTFQLDVKSAFTQAPLAETVYMKAPEFLPGFKGKILQLFKSLYGLRVAGHNWHEKLKVILTKSAGLKQSRRDLCVFFTDGAILTVHVDDMIVTAITPSSLFNVVNTVIEAVPSTGQREIKHYLGLKIVKSSRTMHISCPMHIQRAIEEFNIEDERDVHTPATERLSARANHERPVSIRLMQKMVGMLLWISRAARPDIAYSVAQLCPHTTKPSQRHLDAARRVLCYLKATKNFGIRVELGRKAPTVEVYSDADFMRHDGEKSMTGVVVTCNGSPIEWRSHKQHTVSTSTYDSELTAAFEASELAVHFKELTTELGVLANGIPITIFEDNSSVCLFSERFTTNERVHHIPNTHCARS